ncbi:MAG: bifunctional oligoribonuclease/PAP phosphatase NrnA [Rikenellaceae bacterium]
MKLQQESISQLAELLATPRRVLIIGHTNPDGDAMGSTLALRGVLQSRGHVAQTLVPNRFPYFLSWMEGSAETLIYRLEAERCKEAIAAAEVIFCLDFNSTSRLEQMSEALAENISAKRVLIDHHLSPEREAFDIVFSHPEESSTCFVLYTILEALYGTNAIDRSTAELIYLGMMTDTGNFSFGRLSPELFRALATLAECGIDIPKIKNHIYNSYTEDRARLFGYVINRKMESLQDGTVAMLSLTESELRRFRFQQGDSEGFVNYPLTIGKMKISALFIEQRKFIRVSLRSRGEVDVNEFSRRYFSGGGHKNAAGGKSFATMEQTLAKFRSAIAEFTAEGKL